MDDLETTVLEISGAMVALNRKLETKFNMQKVRQDKQPDEPTNINDIIQRAKDPASLAGKSIKDLVKGKGNG